MIISWIWTPTLMPNPAKFLDFWTLLFLPHRLASEMFRFQGQDIRQAPEAYPQKSDLAGSIPVEVGFDCRMGLFPGAKTVFRLSKCVTEIN